MSKLFNKKIKVDCNKQGLPFRLVSGTYCKAVYMILDYWHDTGCWWEGESEKAFYRLSCQGNGILEIFKDLQSNEWFLYKIYD